MLWALRMGETCSSPSRDSLSGRGISHTHQEEYKAGCTSCSKRAAQECQGISEPEIILGAGRGPGGEGLWSWACEDRAAFGPRRGRIGALAGGNGLSKGYRAKVTRVTFRRPDFNSFLLFSLSQEF